jgi:ankyrin repeat protein
MCRNAVGDPDLTRWFLEHGADPNASCLLDLTPTSYAVGNGPMAVFNMLLDSGADVHKGQLLHYAVGRTDGAEEFVTRLLDLGCSINEIKYQLDPTSWEERWIHGLGTALHRAAEFSSISVVRILLKRGADTSVLDSKGLTALHWAKYRGRDDVVKLLEEWEEMGNSIRHKVGR